MKDCIKDKLDKKTLKRHIFLIGSAYLIIFVPSLYLFDNYERHLQLLRLFGEIPHGVQTAYTLLNILIPVLFFIAFYIQTKNQSYLRFVLYIFVAALIAHPFYWFITRPSFSHFAFKEMITFPSHTIFFYTGFIALIFLLVTQPFNMLREIALVADIRRWCVINLTFIFSSIIAILIFELLFVGFDLKLLLDLVLGDSSILFKVRELIIHIKRDWLLLPSRK